MGVWVSKQEWSSVNKPVPISYSVVLNKCFYLFGGGSFEILGQLCLGHLR